MSSLRGISVFTVSMAFVLSAVLCGPAHAFETDQFTLPEEPIQDVGALVSEKVYHALELAIQQTNEELASAQNDAETAKLRDDRHLASLVYEQTGVGLPEAELEAWLHYTIFRLPRPMRFSPPFWKTIYWGVFTQIPGELLFFHSPTVKLYGVSLGTDKMGHFFQEGHQYYERYFEVLDRGETPEQAHDEAVAIGQGEEHGIDGSAIDGVFSNGDLAANYAGFKFYSNLAHPIQIGSETLEPMLRFEGGRWVYARPLDPESLLKPFISEHLNEALNPSRYKFSKWLIRWHVRDRCATWHEQFPSITHESETTRLKALASWYGEDYGHWLPDGDLISLTTECYP